MTRQRWSFRAPLVAIVVASLTAGVTALAPIASAVRADERPNIVLIMSDDMGWSDLGCYGGEIATPTLDSLAADGIRFTQFYNTGRCCPTRASLLTGLYPHQAGVGHMTYDNGLGLPGYQGELNRNCRTIAEVLRPAGYSTYAVGKWHVAIDTTPDGDKHDWPMQRGFDRFYGTITGAGDFYDPGTLTRDNRMISPFADEEYRPETYYYTDAISEHAVRFVRDHADAEPEQPFFMYVAYTAAHWPMHALPEDIAKYRGKYDDGYEPIRAARFRRAKELGLIPQDATFAPHVGDWSQVENQAWEARCMEVYAAMIDRMDQGIARIVSELKRTGRWENTLVLFLQDNGGCQEGVGRNPRDAVDPDKTFPAFPADALRTEVHPNQTRDGRPVRRGPGVMPGPGDTYIAYGIDWANVSNTPFREYKHFVHEGGISTPLIAHWPTAIAKPGSLESQPGHLVDLMATCVDLADANYPTEVDGESIYPLEGVSLAPAFAGASLDRKQPLFWEHEGNRAVRDGKWKLVAKEDRPWELYDLTADRAEQNDLAESRPDLVKELAAKWDAYAARANVLPLGGWKMRANAAMFSTKKRFELAGDADLDRGKAPDVANRGFECRVTIAEPGERGVLVAQGGSAHGWSLALDDGHLTAYVMRDGNRSQLRTDDAVELHAGSVVTLSLRKGGRCSIAVDERIVADGKVAGALVSMPVDGLQVGRDSGGIVGDYEGPYPFDGAVKSVTIELSARP